MGGGFTYGSFTSMAVMEVGQTDVVRAQQQTWGWGGDGMGTLLIHNTGGYFHDIVHLVYPSRSIYEQETNP